jgi:hypothetical protein
MTAFIARNATETIGFIKTEADEALTQWAVNLSKEYISIPTHVYELPYVRKFLSLAPVDKTNSAASTDLADLTTCPLLNSSTRPHLQRRATLKAREDCQENSTRTCTE